MRKYSRQNSTSGNVGLLLITKKSFKNYTVYSDTIHNTRYSKAYARASTKINILAKRQEDFYGNEIPFFKKMKFMIEFQLKKLLRIFFGLK